MSESMLFDSKPQHGQRNFFLVPTFGPAHTMTTLSFCMATCWPCSGVGGGNPECARCLAAGVWVDRFSSKRGKGHRLARMEGRGKRRVAVTRCGQRIDYHDIGQATAVRKECRHCWPEPEETA